MGVGSAALFALIWMGLLFLVAAMADRRAQRFPGQQIPARHRRQRHLAYTLALGVYCSSWTIYGAVGSAVRTGWDYLPIYAAPILLLVLAPGFLRQLSRAVAEEQAVTISDFIAARFGHDPVVARLVTLIALAGTVPYMALQFRSMGTAFSIVTGQAVVVPTMLAGGAVLAAFAMLFGARRFELTGRSEGMIYAVGLESVMKMGAMLLVSALAVVMVMQAAPDRLAQGWALLEVRLAPRTISLDTVAIALVSAMSIINLPRQFYMALAEARDVDDLPRARFGFAAYLAVMAVAVFPIALAGLTVLPSVLPPDFYVLSLPQAGGHRVVMAIELLGGISAAAAMVITDSTALATMVSNDLVFPTVIRATGGVTQAGALGRRMLLVRRASILGVVALALVWALMVSPEDSLASIGLVAFAAMAQFTPHLIMAATGRRRDPLAARVSLSLGFALWIYTLALPPILPPEWRAVLAQGPADPLRLLGIGHASPLVHGLAWSLGVNLLSYMLVALRKVQGVPLPALMRWQQISDMGQLRDLVASFVGQDKASDEFPEAVRGDPIDRRAAQRARKLIGAVVGTSAARSLVASALAGGRMTLAQVTRLLDERGHALGFSRQVLTATFENIEAGISVVDADLNLVAWNSRYEAIFRYPQGMVYVGMPVADLIRYNASRGELGPGDQEEQVRRRLDHLRRGMPHEIERQRRDGTVIKISGGPMPGGGYVIAYTDITSEATVRAELRQTLAQMESRVAARTAELSQANRQLARATADKTRFLAAASHDLLQPLHAARLFTAALSRDVDDGVLDRARVLVSRVDSAITAAEGLLRALLDISKLDAGGVTPRVEPLALGPFLADLVDGFYPMAEDKGLSLKHGPLTGAGLDVASDAGLLRSLLQNFLANALRYTVEGGVVIGVRRRRGPDGARWLRVDVVDTGVGIPADKIESIFGEFTRLGDVEAEGLGLGLALSERIARLLGGRIEVASVPGRGSRFSLWLAVQDGVNADPVAAEPVALPSRHRPLTVLVIDDDARTVEASVALLASMGHRAIGAAGGAEALPHALEVDAALVDYRLEHGEDGLTVVQELRALKPGLPAMLITAEDNAWIRDLAAALRMEMHAKPAAPKVIERFLGRVAAGA